MKVRILILHVLFSNLAREKQALSQKTGPEAEEGSTDQSLNPNPILGFRLRSVVAPSVADISTEKSARLH